MGLSLMSINEEDLEIPGWKPIMKFKGDIDGFLISGQRRFRLKALIFFRQNMRTKLLRP